MVLMVLDCTRSGLSGKRGVVARQQHCVARQQGGLVCWRRGVGVGQGHGKYLKKSSRFLKGIGESKSTCAAAGGTEGSVHLSNVGEQGSGAAGANGVPSVVIPLNYAQILGLKGRDLYLDPIINTAYDESFHRELDAGYSAIAKLGKEKLLFAAREGLRRVRGRVSLVHPDVTIEPVLLPGAMALLNQVEHYELVLQLAEQSKIISNRDLKATNKGTIRDYRRDVALAASLANCGLARDALEAGSISLGYARLEEALRKLEEAPGGGRDVSLDLYSNISKALVDLRSDAIVDTLKEPLDLSQLTNRKSAIQTLVQMMTTASDVAAIDAGFVGRVLDYLTSQEIVEMVDWSSVARHGSKYAWWKADIISYVAVAHLVAGFTRRRPAWISKGRKIFAIAHTQQADVAVPMSIAEVLLGETYKAVEILQEDEILGLKLRGAARVPVQTKKVAAPDVMPERDDVMAFIQFHSPSQKDLLPGLCLFVELWLKNVAFMRMRDTRERPFPASLTDYFEAPGTVKYLTSKTGMSAESLLEKAFLLAKGSFKVVEKYAMSLVSSKEVKAYGYYASIAVVGAWAAYYFGGMLISYNNRKQSASKVMGPIPAASNGISSKKKTRKSAASQKNNGNAQTVVLGNAAEARDTSLLSKEEAKNIIESWLEIKAEVMGPRYNMGRLSSILVSPMLDAVQSEAQEASKSGWFWNIRPLRVRIDSMNTDAVNPEGSGYLVVVATVDESADLWATNGKKGDSYKTSYNVEYTLVKKGKTWKISSALVTGR
eukprot:jgi/Picsp_1/1876/NSC_05342-R1_domain protein